MTSSSLSNIYQQVEVNTSNNLKLVVMLYEGATRFLGEAREAILKKDVRGKANSLDRALSIIGELQSTLRLDEGGDIASSLNSLYTFMNERLLEASARMDVRPLDQVIRLLRTLNSAWTEIAQKSEVEHPAAAPPSPAVYSALGVPAGDRRPLEVFG
jgi:flagellar protein FliS